MGGIKFAGNGAMDVGEGNMNDPNSATLQSGGPVMFAKGMEEGYSTGNTEPVNIEGSVPMGGNEVQFVGGEW